MRRFLRSRWGIIVVGILIVTALFTLDRFSLLGPVEHVSSKITSPLLEAGTYIKDRSVNFFAYFSSRQQLWQENQQLRSEIDVLRGELVDRELDLSGLRMLREEQQFLDEQNFSSVPAKVIGRLPAPLEDTFVINRGSQHGITIGDAVITAGGILVGKIIDIQTNTASVLPITNAENEIAARVGNSSSSLGVVVGSHGISSTITLIPQDEPLTKGDRVFTAGNESRIPGGILIGHIEDVVYIQGDLFQSASLTLSANAEDLSIVSVIIP